MAIKVCMDELLKERQLTSKELCAKIGITEANLSTIRSGKARGMRFATLNKICWHLNCEVGDLLKFDGRPDDDIENDEKTIDQKNEEKEEN